mmetsp:Transcript_62309/g.86633  ORF Transcript_62309/g.86633 Transcript_62309/m.86633 type:complete len:225 (-) Transcript_62309:608-1282(-)
MLLAEAQLLRRLHPHTALETRTLRGQEALLVGDGLVCAVCDEVVGQVQEVVLKAVVQRRVAGFVLIVHIDAVLEQQLCNAAMIVLTSDVQHVVAKLVLGFQNAALLLDDRLDGFVAVVAHEGEGDIVVLLEVGELVVLDHLALLVRHGPLGRNHEVWPVRAHDQADVRVHHVTLVWHDGLLRRGCVRMNQQAHVAFASHLLLREGIHIHVGHVNLVVVAALHTL